MRIVSLQKEESGDRARVLASLVWEDNDSPVERLWFETRGAAVGDLSPTPDAFLLASAMPALEYGERRVSIEGTVCPELANGLRSAFAVIRSWFPEMKEPVLEATGGFRPSFPRTPPRTGFLWSGGVDSMGTLCANRRDYPSDHPASIREGLYLFGMNSNDMVGGEPVPERLADFERRAERAAKLADEAGVTLVTVHTNVRFLFKNRRGWGPRGSGAGMAAVAHLFPARLTRALIASSGLTGDLPPLGTHPLLDPNYSSAAVQIRHDGLPYARIQKMAMVAEWDAALANLQCCLKFELPSTINCGQCKKCVRTMLQLVALGKLGSTDAFPTHDVTPEMIERIEITEIGRTNDADFLEETAALLDARGRDDLARAVRNRVASFRSLQRQRERREALRAWDRRWTGGMVGRVAEALGLRG